MFRKEKIFDFGVAFPNVINAPPIPNIICPAIDLKFVVHNTHSNLIAEGNLYFFGKNQYDVSFKGVKNIYTQKYEIIAGAGHLNSSSNVTYNANYPHLSASADVMDNDAFIYISGINFHDENMNVVGKAKLAQPVIKREKDKILFKVTFDF
ncbi:MAG: hypothetical protein EBY29_03230 [Planctomycetes bacterium]|nr:hypothetical protein [Planctomycetota bacterium]